MMQKIGFSLSWFSVLAPALLLLFVNPLFAQQTAKTPPIGACNGLKDANMLKDAGFVFAEEGVPNFLQMDLSEAQFDSLLAVAPKPAMPVKALIYFLPGKLKSVGPEADHKGILEYAETVFRRAKKRGVGMVVFGSGGSRRIPDGFSYEKAWEQMRELCVRLAPLAAKHQVVLVLESLNSKECNFITTLGEAGKMVQEVNHPNFRLLADLYHMKTENEGPESIQQYGSLIKHVHIAEREGRAAPGIHGEDFGPYFKALQDAGYQGGISLENNWGDKSSEAPQVVKTIREQWLKAVQSKSLK
ncbi:Xylose isomerase domain protein TIM barrel [Mariniradius saccharolyticus AK6]|uniref:Xylose isomerase domain protein TIM barrel n=1 Tax=Mariniradius saccharolyticus AK6 TaxID=1239962 RepID=M7XFG1_9BACT|nr:sugar phosphate isomerase/epimerase family protein [Mariniradius saccharolyticus]EMS33273.1 Xylose isomerase domain protein TIM barrel [Mariniradius saccharolyticus AK6]